MFTTSGMQKLVPLFLTTIILQGSTRAGVAAICFFPPEYTGEFVMQKSINTSGNVEYSRINITFLGTPLWGSCYKRYDNNFIFTLSNDNSPCLRCLNLNLKSKNVLQVRSTNYTHCYLQEDEAIASCPQENIKNNDDIILFKVSDLLGYPAPKEFCPLGDKYTVSYNTISTDLDFCMQREGTLSTCSSNSMMNLKFQRCEGNSSDFELYCIGSWTDPNGQRYLALEDTRKKPTYRCALYHETLENGQIHIALSRDSTCDMHLQSPRHGYETITLSPVPYKEDGKWLDEIASSDCRFPEWAQGEWEHVKVENNKFYYKDHDDFVNYELTCLTNLKEDKYVVYSRMHCTEKRYNCLWIQQRSDDVFEFQLGGMFSKFKTEHLCDPTNKPDKWVTQYRKFAVSPVKCPISGVFKGRVPDTKTYCSNLSSDCKTPDLMYYKVFNCVTMEFYEEREYRCLGYWKDDDLLYTYTQRQDKIAAGTYECFVGSIVSDKEDYINIKEAGEHCQRNMDALTAGMKLIKQKQLTVLCVDNDTSSDIRTYGNKVDKKTDLAVYETKIPNNQTTQILDNKSSNEKVNLKSGAALREVSFTAACNLILMIIVIIL